MSKRYADCQVRVVYETPLSYGRSYVGQTGHCVNEKQRKHSSSIPAAPSGNLTVSGSRCGYPPSFTSVNLLARKADRVCSEIIQVYFIR